MTPPVVACPRPGNARAGLAKRLGRLEAAWPLLSCCGPDPDDPVGLGTCRYLCTRVHVYLLKADVHLQFLHAACRYNTFSTSEASGSCGFRHEQKDLALSIPKPAIVLFRAMIGALQSRFWPSEALNNLVVTTDSYCAIKGATKYCVVWLAKVAVGTRLEPRFRRCYCSRHRLYSWGLRVHSLHIPGVLDPPANKTAREEHYKVLSEILGVGA